MLFSQLNIFLDVPCVAQPLIIFYPIIFKIRLNEGLTTEMIMNSNIYLPSTVVSLKNLVIIQAVSPYLFTTKCFIFYCLALFYTLSNVAAK